MNSYRTLTYKELNILQEDFTHFLYLEGYSRFDWTILVEEHPEYAIDMLNRYSDLAFEKIMKGINYVERLKNGRLTAIFCHKFYFDITAIDLDLKQINLLTQGKDLAQVIKLGKTRFNLRFKKIKYSIQREYEIFDLIERGYQPSNDYNYQIIKELKKTLEN